MPIGAYMAPGRADCMAARRTDSLEHARTVPQVSFVNAIATTKGGTHVDYIVNQFVK